MGQIKGKVLVSQCIPKDRATWGIATADNFWTARREELARAFNEFLASCFPDRKNIA
jgi:hypothetical protein